MTAENSEETLAVGSTVWMFDENHRVYHKDERGRAAGGSGPIYREHWLPVNITGEDRLNWITNRGKFPKRPRKGQYAGIRIPNFGGFPIARTLADVEDDVWARSNRYSIVRAVERAEVQQLRQVAELLKWKPEAK